MLKQKIKNLAILNFLIIPVGVSINVVGYQISQILRLPILIDSIGTILSGVLGGPIIGLFTGALSTCVNSLINPITFAYIPTSIIIGVLAGLFGKFGWIKSVLGIILSGIIMTFFTTLISGIITFYLFGGATGSSASILTASLYALGNSLLKSIFSVQLLQECIDKTISLIMVFFILKILPPRFVVKFDNGEVLLNAEKAK